MKAFEYLMDRGVKRLCHFTKIKDLTHILFDDKGITSSQNINTDVRDQKDKLRLDGKKSHVSCSIEYPNSWYLRNAIRRDVNDIFKEWVVIYIDPSILLHRDSLFCPCNAAKAYGRYISSKESDICKLYSPQILDRQRAPKMLRCCPTDDQAEILIKDDIPIRFFRGFAVSCEDNARTILTIMKTYEIDLLPIYIAPDVLGTGWSTLVRRGIRPREDLFPYSVEE